MTDFLLGVLVGWLSLIGAIHWAAASPEPTPNALARPRKYRTLAWDTEWVKGGRKDEQLPVFGAYPIRVKDVRRFYVVTVGRHAHPTVTRCCGRFEPFAKERGRGKPVYGEWMEYLFKRGWAAPRGANGWAITESGKAGLKRWIDGAY